jgi:hypothetical protein
MGTSGRWCLCVAACDVVSGPLHTTIAPSAREPRRVHSSSSYVPPPLASRVKLDRSSHCEHRALDRRTKHAGNMTSGILQRGRATPRASTHPHSDDRPADSRRAQSRSQARHFCREAALTSEWNIMQPFTRHQTVDKISGYPISVSNCHKLPSLKHRSVESFLFRKQEI